MLGVVTVRGKGGQGAKVEGVERVEKDTAKFNHEPHEAHEIAVVFYRLFSFARGLQRVCKDFANPLQTSCKCLAKNGTS